jgi:AraC family transcriptional regulator, regulatory protein of adaptative response / methylated-DNA-[protein]-cysteine methyltransferase
MNSAQVFTRVQAAIGFLHSNFKSQPSLDEVAAHVHLSPHHFQRMFADWAGTSPKKFLQYISLSHAKHLLKNEQATLFDAALQTGLSGSSRLHDLFVSIEGMTPGEYKNGGEQLNIYYSFAMTPFGPVMVASTDRGICHLAFYDDETVAFNLLKNQFPHAKYQHILDKSQQNALVIFQKDWRDLQMVKLHLKGSAFQLKVWETLLKIPCAQLMTYNTIAKAVDSPKAARAVGSAVGGNPVAYLIPCHRVIQTSGALGGYHWGLPRKSAMIGWEAALANAALEQTLA